MILRLFAALLLVAASDGVLYAQARTGAPCDADAIRRRVCAVDDSLGRALIRADTATLGLLYADDLVTINYRGVRLTKPMLLTSIAERRLRFDTLQASKRSVEVYGDTALLKERMHQVATGAEGPHPTEVDYRRTYVRRGKRWQLIAAVIAVATPP